MSDPIEPSKIIDPDGQTVPTKKSRFSKKNIAIVAGTAATVAAAAYAYVKFNEEDETDIVIDGVTIEEPKPFQVDVDVTTPES